MSPRVTVRRSAGRTSIFRYAARQDWDKIAKLLKPVYTAPFEEAALARFAAFADT
ncbi:hypothetical protein [Streptomyces violaceusniger]|uniref:Uncharacterized protein n=1 Tax=Streptomyces violaceusniger TaxID=68280 RepID=A0A4D4KVD3_STRVO|nr:hypothetical protein SVIO_004060 [Streptomyces violaceusniger]